ncbi:2OG-Fe(II) oxygenase superfamily protein [Lyngbya aestuarii BL J]|uniref:2OG-Fe(II) oxygenase superfamily protein n=1 Tax=Lyngbya aestuarii BL J TaxID=1348334 RepID=U7QPI8_9CYAN|nr:2OG-Fe(II) oxygenase [Lyngbya aestuarii]ERT09197.1 2OG-Fe(II) oxygenase superfamily protein [Lyngbya aestuarii BL J]
MSSALTFCIDPEYLDNLATQYRESYAQAQPYPHIVIDNFLPESILDHILDEFPKPDTIDWHKFNGNYSKKLASSSELQMGESTRFLLYQLNSSIFIRFLEKLTGIEGIIPDPHFKGGGLHQIERGGFLKVHVDFNRHEKLDIDRRLNLLIYLNKDWKEEYGGYFELWDSEMTGCKKKVLPLFNRCVIFSTTDFSYHGHPDPLNCPEGLSRKSLALYYYSNGRPTEEISDGHTTVFQARPGEQLPNKPVGEDTKTILKKFIPPILIDLGSSLKKKSNSKK